MRRHIIFSADNGEAVTLSFTKCQDLDGKKYGIWHTYTNEIHLCKEAWDFMEAHRNDVRKLKPLMDRLEKIAAGDSIRINTPHQFMVDTGKIYL